MELSEVTSQRHMLANFANSVVGHAIANLDSLTNPAVNYEAEADLQDVYEENIKSLNSRPPDIDIFHALGDAIKAYPVLDARRKLCAVLDNCMNLNINMNFIEYVVTSSVEIIFIFAEKEVDAIARTIPQLFHPEYHIVKIVLYNKIWRNIQQTINRFPGVRLVTLLRAIGNAIQTRSRGNINNDMRDYLCGFFQWVLDEFNFVQEQLGLPCTEPFSFIEWVNRQPTPSLCSSLHTLRLSRRA